MHRDQIFLNLNTQVDAEKLVWVQGAGGNTSVKIGEKLFVKASGTRIRDLKSMDQLASLDLERLRGILKDVSSMADPESAYKEAIEICTYAQSPRPSMESGFHAWLPATYVFHIHSLAAVCMAEIVSSLETRQFGEWYQQNWFSKLGGLLIIEACLPGLELTQKISTAKLPIEEGRPWASIYWLKNHGAILAFEDEGFIDQYKVFEEAALRQFLPIAAKAMEQWRGFDARTLLNRVPDLSEADLRFYFPDMAIMYPRIKQGLHRVANERYRYEANPVTSDQDALENWLASAMLQKMMPSLPVLPEAVCAAIPNLPTEIERKKKMETL